MKQLSLLAGCCLMFGSTLLLRANVADSSTAEQNPHSGIEQPQQADCGGEPCDAVVRGLRAFFDRTPDGLDGNGRACADCHMATDQFQLSPASAEARFRFLQLRRQFNPEADDPLFRPIDADDFRTNGDAASDFSNLRQNGLVNYPPASAEYQPHRSGNQRAFDRSVRRRVAERADRQRRRPHGSGWRNPLAPRAEPAGGPSWTRGWRRCRSKRSVPSSITRRPRTRRRHSFSTI